MKHKARWIASALLSLTFLGCGLTDFRQQPSIAPWQSLSTTWADTSTPYRGNPQGSVPTSGTAVASWQVSYSKNEKTIDSMATLRNPEPATQASVDRGYRYFQTNCAVCHGVGGAGDGTAVKFNVFAPSLMEALTKGRSDGYIFGMIRNGRNNMPTMNRIGDRDRWHIINYLRGLQGLLPANITIRKEPAGLPGETGSTLPGPTDVAPTHPAPASKPVYVPTVGAAKSEKQQ